MISAYFFTHQNLRPFIEDLRSIVGTQIGVVHEAELRVDFTSLEWGRHEADIRELARDYGGRFACSSA